MREREIGKDELYIQLRPSKKKVKEEEEEEEVEAEEEEEKGEKKYKQVHLGAFLVWMTKSELQRPACIWDLKRARGFSAHFIYYIYIYAAL